MSQEENHRDKADSERKTAGPALPPDGGRPAAEANTTTDNDGAADLPADPMARRLYDVIGGRYFRLWFDGAQFSDTERLQVTVGTVFQADYIRAHFLAELTALAGSSPVRVVAREGAAGG